MFVSNRPELKKVVRVATNNNFNCTLKEFKQLKDIEIAHPDSVFFVNSNINTPELLRINKNPYKVVVTINPTLTVRPESIARLKELDKNKVAFVRVKYLPEHPEIKDLVTSLVKDNYAIVLTLQRWNGIESLRNYTNRRHNTFEHNRFRLSGEALKEVTEFVDSFDKGKVFLCDRVGGGCGTCKLCVILTAGINLKLTSVNLSSSGLCKFNCPDCYAKTMQNMSRAFGYQLITYDKIKANSKQAGKSQHAKDALKHIKQEV
jgi:hypothetical protein